MIRTPTIDGLNPIDWTHTDNAGLQLALLGLPGYAGGSRWADATRRTAGGTSKTAGTALPQWAGNSLAFTQAGQGFVDLGNSAAVQPSDGLAIALTYQTLSGFSTRYRFYGWGLNLSGQNFSPLIFCEPSRDSNFANPTINRPNASNGQFHRVVMAFSVSTNAGRLYFDGQLAGSFSVPQTPTRISYGSGLAAIGREGDFNSFFRDFRLRDYWLFGRGVDAGWAARDYEWSLDPSRDPRLRRLTGVVTFGPMGGPSIISGSCEIFAGTGVEIATGTNLGATTGAAGSTASVSVLGCLPVGEAVLSGGVIFDPIGAAAVCAVVTILGITALDSATGSLTVVNTHFGGGATWSITSGSLAIGSGVFQCDTVFVGSMQTVVPLAVVNTIVLVGQICKAYSITTSIAHTVTAESYVCRTVTLERS
jgi:hypothetical protein